MAKGSANARLSVLIGFGDELDDASFFALSIPDARDLVRMVQNALASPAPLLDA